MKFKAPFYVTFRIYLSLIKRKSGAGKVSDEEVTFKPLGEREILLTPEDSIRFQMELRTDLLVVLDDRLDNFLKINMYLNS